MKTKPKSSNAQPTLQIDAEVVRQIRQHARSSNKAEVCGVLIGRDRDQHVEVAACIEGQNAEEAGAHVTFTQDTWEHIYAEKDQKYPEQRIVGWYHSHPGFGVFLSDHDTFIHKNFFSSPGQVAWVFDPHSDEEGCFGWVSGHIERLKQIGVVDRRGGEEAQEGCGAEPGSTDGAQIHAAASGKSEKQEAVAIKIRRLDPNTDEDENSEGSDSSLERLVFGVFFYLAALALGFALCWYVFPRVELLPVLLDPRTGQLIDPQTGQVVAEPLHPTGSPKGPASSVQPDSNQSGQPSSSTQSGKKGNDAHPK